MAENTRTRRRGWTPVLAAGAALTLAGCAATHVGNDWQCPPAQGAHCVRVAAADPAVKGLDGDEPANVAPFNLASGTDDRGAASGFERPDPGPRNGCPRGCNPVAWVARLFNGGADGGTPQDGNGHVAERTMDEPAPQQIAGDAATEETDGARASRSAVGQLFSHADVRTPETIARVWIAPFVDADGVYREASWVRLVITPAEWRQP